MRAKWAALSLASVGAIALAGSIAWAAIPGDGGVLSLCYDARSGALRVIDKDAGAKCGSKEVPLAAYSKAGADAAFLAATAKASDADKLDGLDSAQLARVAWAGEITIATTVPAGGCTDVHAPTGLVDFNIPNAHFSVVVTPNRTPGPQEVLTFTGMIDRNFGAGAGAPAIRMCNPSDSAVELTSLSVGLAVLRVDLFG